MHHSPQASIGIRCYRVLGQPLQSACSRQGEPNVSRARLVRGYQKILRVTNAVTTMHRLGALQVASEGAGGAPAGTAPQGRLNFLSARGFRVRRATEAV